MAITDQARLACTWLRHQATARTPGSKAPPFFQDFHQQVVVPAHQSAGFEQLEALRRQWRKSPDRLAITDLGAGSHGGSPTTRTVRQIARYSLTPASFSRLLAQLIGQRGYQQLAELGTSLGLNTLYMHKALAGHGYLHTFEGCPNLVHRAQSLFDTYAEGAITTHQGNLDHTWPAFLASLSAPLDLVYMDANHRYQPTLRYFEACLPHLHAGSCVVVDDIYWSEEMHQAWQALRRHAQVSASIDVWEAGFLFFDPTLPRQCWRMPKQ